MNIILDEIKTKVCTKCGIRKSLNDFYIRRDKGKKETIRSFCKLCSNSIYKETRNNYYQNNKEKCNAKSAARVKLKYNTDTSFKERHKEYHKNYRIAHTQKYCKVCSCELPYGKNFQAYCNECRKEVIKIKTKDNRQKLGKDHINKIQNIKHKKYIDNLSDCYIASNIRGTKYTGLKLEMIPKEVIETVRIVLKMKRVIKNKSN